MNKSLKDKAIDIHGKKYVQVKDRIVYFNENYPHGCIETKIVKDDDNRVVVKAKVTPDVEVPNRYFTGISASNPSKSIEAQVPHEVAETSAVGRALAMMGIGVIDSIASVDEMNKTTSTTNTPPGASNNTTGLVTMPQVKLINTLISKTKTDRDEVKKFFKVASLNQLKQSDAQTLIKKLQAKGEVH